MKGLKCINRPIKRLSLRYSLALLLILFLSVSFSRSASSASITTNELNIYYSANWNAGYSWSNYIHASSGDIEQSILYPRAIRSVGIRYNSIYSEGNYASMHFETNLVTWNFGYDVSGSGIRNNWINLDRLVVQACSFNNRTLVIENQTISTAVTHWWDSFNGSWKHTLTIYGDVVFSDVPSGMSGSIVCDVSTNNSSDFMWSDYPEYQMFYWERNPTIITFGNNINDALLQMQIDQNNQIINNINNVNESISNNYNKDKEEEREREQDVTDSQSGNFLGTLNNLLFPFSGMFTTLGQRGCFTPTNLNNWLHTTGQYCPWFSTSVTDAVSSVLLALSTIITFGFVIKWLKKEE